MVRRSSVPQTPTDQKVYLHASYHHTPPLLTINMISMAPCFLAAIQGPSCMFDDGPGLIDDSIWLFSPDRIGAHHGDYHNVFNGNNFCAWFKNCLLPSINEPSMIIMDNAAYHKVKELGTPKAHKLKQKAETIHWLNYYGEIHDTRATAAHIFNQLKTYDIHQCKCHNAL